MPVGSTEYASYQGSLMATHGIESWFCAPPPANPARDTRSRDGWKSQPSRDLVSEPFQPATRHMLTPSETPLWQFQHNS